MSEATTMGRNDPCRCGSGRRYKKCCGPRDAANRQSRRRLLLALGLVVLGAGAVAFYAIARNDRSQTVSTNSASIPALPHVNVPSEPLDLPAVPGKVWSKEHGHFHDETSAEGPETFKPGPQPPGPVPSGKAWSEEHGHWHDLAKPGEWVAKPQPRGPVPPGKTWSVEHGHWHLIGQTTEEQATQPAAAAEPPQTKPVPQPEGPAPPGKVWSSKHGHWHDIKEP
ncbi:MAG: SEC-C metal-binding domain-containing protein [Acidobacteriota bacterium]